MIRVVLKPPNQSADSEFHLILGCGLCSLSSRAVLDSSRWSKKQGLQPLYLGKRLKEQGVVRISEQEIAHELEQMKDYVRPNHLLKR